MTDTNRIERVIAYIDGFNLYFGMKEIGNNTLWVNVQKLVSSLLKPTQKLVYTKYFTSRVRNNPLKERRQNIYLESLGTLSECKIIYGHYQSHIERCRRCGHSYPYANEKMTDVNIAVSLMEDAFHDKYDMAFLVTGDSDLVPPINSVHALFPDKRIFVAFPPNRFNVSMKNVSKGSMMIGKKKLKDAQFPNTIIKADGFALQKPIEWN